MAWQRAAQMTTNSNTETNEREKSPWFQVARFLLLVALVVFLYLLGMSMVHNRFFQGGHIDRHGHISR
jgi:hypothetical protein